MTPDPASPVTTGPTGRVTCYECGTTNDGHTIFCRDCRTRLRTGWTASTW